MDPIVLRAMAKWPNVPAVYDWLALDRRGHWRLRGERIGNTAANAFIDRNYAVDERGCWYFQNGPQQVFVTLAYAPWVLSLDGTGELRTHTGQPVRQPSAAYLDDEANLLIAFEHGVGLLDDRDLAPISEAFVAASGEPLSDAALEAVFGRAGENALEHVGLRLGATKVPVAWIRIEDVAVRFGFEPEPNPESSPQSRP